MRVPSSTSLAEALRAEQVLDSLSSAVLLIDEEQSVQLANEACRDFFPGSGDWVGKPLISVVMDHRIDRCVSRVRAEQRPLRELIDNPSAQVDSQVWWELQAKPLEIAQERWVSLIVRDETERQRTEQMRRDFVANASHELRTPLTIMRGGLENVLMAGLEDKDMSLRILNTALRHAERLGRLVEDMLAISRLERGEELPLHRESFDLNAVALVVLERLEPLLEQRDVEVGLEIAPELQSCQGDGFYWEQILYNLLENALKNNEDKDDLELMISAEIEGDDWILEICDNGIGIPRAALPFIFNRFYRVQKDHGPAMPGTGLGLSIVKRAVEAHGGQISVSSISGQRTCFRIEVPLDLAAGE